MWVLGPPNKIPLPRLESIGSLSRRKAAWEVWWTYRPHAPPWRIDPPPSRDQRMFRVLCFKHRPHSRSWEQFCILWSDDLAWHFFFTFPFCSSVAPLPPSSHSKQDLEGSPLLHLLNHFKRSSSLFHPRRAPKLMASFGFGTRLALSPPPPAFFLYLSFFFVKWARQKAKAIEAHLCWLSWIEGPLSWLFMSTALQKHTYKSHPASPLSGSLRYQDDDDDDDGRDGRG